jgi:hypothetical protein
MRKRMWWVVGGVGIALAVAGAAAAWSGDFGLPTEHDLAQRSNQLFGVRSALPASSSRDLDAAQALADPARLVTLNGLHAHVVAAGPDADVGPNSDQMVLWPPSHPTHLIAVNKEGSSEPGLQKIDLATGKATSDRDRHRRQRPRARDAVGNRHLRRGGR